uniref:Uncharacterized protein n=1 Tax=Rhizophora mucronata TaxID=61149 RepID=A0A2P2JWM1_RHIMU
MRRERTLAYAFSHQVINSSAYFRYGMLNIWINYLVKEP